MENLHWLGPEPPRAVVSLLRTLDLALSAKAPRARVIATRTAARAPEPVADAVPWLWWSAGSISPAAARLAAARGAYDVIAGDRERLAARLRELLRDEQLHAPASTLVLESPAAKRMVAEIARAARTSMPVLLTGETGTGKELAARLIHTWSERRRGTFVPVNCAAIPNELMEGELFGYVRGAFSGAVRDYDGLMMAASGGTVFLDEVDDTPLPLQVKLLRVLDDRMVSRLGETAPRKADFRILAATNRDLRALIDTGAFGADLFERLAIVSIQLAPLRERTLDIPHLVHHLIARFYEMEPAARVRAEVTSVTPEVLAALTRYPWPGNVRELRNVIYGALVNKRAGDALLLSDLPKRILGAGEPRGSGLVDPAALARRLDDGGFNLRAAVADLERVALLAALDRAGGNAARAAALLGAVGRGTAADPGGTVRSMMRRLGVSRSR